MALIFRRRSKNSLPRISRIVRIKCETHRSFDYAVTSLSLVMASLRMTKLRAQLALPTRLLLCSYRVFLYFDRDLGRVEKRVVDQAVVYGAFHSGAVLFRQLERGFDFDAEIVEAGGIFGFVGDDADVGAFRGELELAQVLRRVESGARCERGQQELRRRHALVEASVFLGLVARDGVLTGFDFELHGAEMFDCDFHDDLPTGAKAP